MRREVTRARRLRFLPACPVAFALALALAGTAVADAVPIVTPDVAGAPWTSADVAKLDADLDEMLANAAPIRGAHVGVFAVETRTGMPLYAHSADDLFQAASSTKLIVGSVALERLGPAFRFRTTAALDAAGTLVLRGGGDPLLAAGDVGALADAGAGAGTRGAIRDVRIDDSLLERAPYPDGWTVDDVPYDYSAPVSALAVDENTVHIRVSPAAQPGRAALVAAPPHATLLPAGAACSSAAAPGVVSLATTGAAGSESTLDVARDASGCILVTGSIAEGASPETLDAAVPNPVAYARGVLLDALAARGISAAALPARAPAGPVSAAGPSGPESAGRTFWSHDSPPLAAFLGPRFWIPSDNLVGELLLRQLGLASRGAPGTTAAGVAAETAWLRAAGVPPVAFSLFDGSGLSRYDRVTPRALVTVLEHDWTGPNRRLVLDSLPVGGARGTIEGIAGTIAAGRVFAKTGSFMHVRGLAGYLAPLRHGAVTFAFIVDDWFGSDPEALAAFRGRILSRIVADS